LEFIRIFSRRNHFKINISHILNPNLTKEIPLHPAHQDLSNNTKGTFQFLQNFQLGFNFIFSEEIIQYSKTFAPQVQTPWNQVDAPLLLLENQERHLKHPSSVSLICIKQNKTNKQPCFIDRLVWLVPFAQVLLHVQPIFPSKTWFLEFYLNFQQQKSL
jgi:hypothetical protein